MATTQRRQPRRTAGLSATGKTELTISLNTKFFKASLGIPCTILCGLPPFGWGLRGEG